MSSNPPNEEASENPLVPLRERFGNELVDEMLKVGLLCVPPLHQKARLLANQLLEWEPAIEKPPAGYVSRLERWSPEQLLSTNLPHLPWPATTTDSCRSSIEAFFIALIERAYPALLASSVTHARDGSWGPIRLRAAPEHEQAASALRGVSGADELWDADEITTPFGTMKNWTELYDPVELIIYSAWRLCLLRGDWTIAAAEQAVREQLGRVVEAAAGRAAKAPVFLGFGGVACSGEVSFQEVTIRPYQGKLQGSLLGYGDRLDAQGNGLIVEAMRPWTFSTPNVDGSDHGARYTWEGGWELSAHWAHAFAVSIAISQAPERIRPHHCKGACSFTRAPHLRWMLAGDPLYGARSFHFSQGWKAPGPAIEPSIDMLRRAEALAAIKDVPTRTAIGRLGAALEEPRRWADALVDAVIAWEAMSGDCTTATTLKVSSVLARLVSKQNHWKQVRREIEGLYKVRSKIVHGGGVQVTREHLHAALAIGVVALRRLVDDFPQLIGRSDRFERLVLDA